MDKWSNCYSIARDTECHIWWRSCFVNILLREYPVLYFETRQLHKNCNIPEKFLWTSSSTKCVSLQIAHRTQLILAREEFDDANATAARRRCNTLTHYFSRVDLNDWVIGERNRLPSLRQACWLLLLPSIPPSSTAPKRLAAKRKGYSKSRPDRFLEEAHAYDVHVKKLLKFLDCLLLTVFHSS